MGGELEAACGAEPERDAADAAFTFTCIMLVLFMQLGFAVLESGCVRTTNMANAFLKNTVDLAVSVLGFYAVGYGFARGDSLGGIIGKNHFLLMQHTDKLDFLHLAAFASTGATIVSGCCSERFSLLPYMGLAVMVSTVVFPICCHWAWHPDGFLKQAGFVDLAGATVVHVLGGSCAFAAVLFIGPRLGWHGKLVPPQYACVQHTLQLSHKAFGGENINSLVGAVILLIGWLAFNASSTAKIQTDNAQAVGHVTFITLVAGSTGLITVVLYNAAFDRYISVLQSGSGLLAGLVSVTASAHVIEAYEAIPIAICTSLCALKAATIFRSYRIDDPIGILPVHLVGGAVASLVPAVFGHQICHIDYPEDSHFGLLYTGTGEALSVQLVGIFAIGFFAGSVTYVYLMFVTYVCKVHIRVSPINEILGIDVMTHGIDAYNRVKVLDELQEILRAMRSQGEFASHIGQTTSLAENIHTNIVTGRQTIPSRHRIVPVNPIPKQDAFSGVGLPFVNSPKSAAVSMGPTSNLEITLPYGARQAPRSPVDLFGSVMESKQHSPGEESFKFRSDRNLGMPSNMSVIEEANRES